MNNLCNNRETKLLILIVDAKLPVIKNLSLELKLLLLNIQNIVLSGNILSIF
jgi:hypothetical protein